MCRNIKRLYHFDPPATSDEIRASALQYVRKVSGFNKPSKANEAAFDAAVAAMTAATQTLLASLKTDAPPRDRVAEAARQRILRERRFPPGASG